MAERDRWPALLDKDLACEYLTCGSRTMDRLMAGGQIVPVKMGAILKFRRDDLDAYIESLPRGDSSRDIAARTPGRRAKQASVSNNKSSNKKHEVADVLSTTAGSAAS